jgi:hypothetical protein
MPCVAGVPKLTVATLLALLLAAHGVSRWDPEPHPFAALQRLRG